VKSKLLVPIVAVVTLLAVGHSQDVLAQSLEGQIQGVEVITQDLGGRAVFLFRFTGKVDGRRRTGFGIIGLNHQSLPSDPTASAAILAGDGTVYAGFRAYSISDVEGSITVNMSGPFLLIFPLQFNVEADLLINDAPHRFSGILRHDTLPFSLQGQLAPSL
jgi:hypothetical protein